MSCEVTVKVKDSQRSFSQKTKISEIITSDFNDPKIDELVSTAVKIFGRNPSKTIVTIKILEE